MSPERKTDLVNKGLHIGIDTGWVGLETRPLQVTPHLHFMPMLCMLGWSVLQKCTSMLPQQIYCTQRQQQWLLCLLCAKQGHVADAAWSPRQHCAHHSDHQHGRHLLGASATSGQQQWPISRQPSLRALLHRKWHMAFVPQVPPDSAACLLATADGQMGEKHLVMVDTQYNRARKVVAWELTSWYQFWVTHFACCPRAASLGCSQVWDLPS